MVLSFDLDNETEYNQCYALRVNSLQCPTCGGYFIPELAKVTDPDAGRCEATFKGKRCALYKGHKNQVHIPEQNES